MYRGWPCFLVESACVAVRNLRPDFGMSWTIMIVETHPTCLDPPCRPLLRHHPRYPLFVFREVFDG